MSEPASDELIAEIEAAANYEAIRGWYFEIDPSKIAALIARIRQQDAEIASIDSGLDDFMRALKSAGVEKDTVMHAIGIARAAPKGGDA